MISLAANLRGGSFLGRIDDAAHVKTASRANDVSWRDSAAFGADRQISGFQRIVRPSFTGTAVGMLAFGDCHDWPRIYLDRSNFDLEA